MDMETVSTPEKEKQSTDALGFVFIGPSAAGKSTLRDEICRRGIHDHSFVPFRPLTSRQRRPGEDEYTYVSDEELNKLSNSKDTLFSNTYHGNRFLTPWPSALEPTQHYIYIYSPEAAKRLKDTFPNTKIIQIVPPELSMIEDRMKARDPSIDEAELQQRLLDTETEIPEGKQIADLVFVNELPLEQSVKLLSAQITKLIT